MTLLDLDTSNILMDFVQITDLENIFNVYTDKNGNYYFNLNMSLYLSVTSDNISIYTCKSDLQWPLISYNIYGTTRLAWLLLKLNEVKPKDVFKILPAGTKVKCISNTLVE